MWEKIAVGKLFDIKTYFLSYLTFNSYLEFDKFIKFIKIFKRRFS